MKEKLAAKPELLEQLVPLAFDPGCRRATFSHGYIEALVDPKTTVFFGSPNKFTPNGFIDEQEIEHSLDIVIAATGYDQSHLSRYSTLVNGVPATDHWSFLNTPGPPCYMAVCMASLPNYFHMSSAYAHVYGSWFATSEVAAKYIVQCIEKIQLERIRTLKVKDRAVEHFVRYANSFLQHMTQSGPCASWYKTEQGRPVTWPGSWSCYERALATPRWEDFEIGYEDEGDMFLFFGNGFTEKDGEIVAAVMDEMSGKKREASPEREVPRSVLEKLKAPYSVASLAPNVEQQQQQAHL